MLVPIKWLKDHVETQLTPQEIAHALTMVGLEVEGLNEKDPGFSGVVTARVEEVERHPNADKLSLCKVTDGSTTYSVVCGASNVVPGITVAFAKIGAVLPDDFKIKRSKIRGVESEGMICSATELKIPGDGSGIMHLTHGLPLNMPVGEALGLVGWTMEVNVTANRPDCLSVIGIAREVANAIGAPLTTSDPVVAREEDDINDGLSVGLEAPEGCPRYSARRVTGVVVKPSPEWMQHYLEQAGVRPINNLVDVTNFVMLEYGQPMHAFDARMIHQGKIVVRWARAGEVLKTLDGAEHKLEAKDLVIADPERPLALAGVMGGEHSGVQDDTTDVILESAYFDPVVVRRTAKRLRMHTESSHRFERGCDPSITRRALDRACQLLEAIAEGRVVGGTIDHYPKVFEPKRIHVRVTRMNQVLGMELERHRMEKLLTGLGLQVHEQLESGVYYDADAMTVIAPTSRPDLTQEADIAEELARLHGYDKIPATPPVLHSTPVHEDPVVLLTRECRQLLIGLGFNEAVSFTFSDVKSDLAVPLANPLKEEEGWLRTDLTHSMLRTLEHNVRHQNTELNLFEVGRTFRKMQQPGKFHQEYRLAILMAGAQAGHWRPGSRTVDYYAIKGVVEVLMRALRLDWMPEAKVSEPPVDTGVFHPARSAHIVVGGKSLGVYGELHPGRSAAFKGEIPVVLAEIVLQGIPELKRVAIAPEAITSFPRADRDVAIVVPDGTNYADIKRVIDEVGGKFLEESRLFDVFSGQTIEAGKKSLALSLSLRHPERTLTEAEIEKTIRRILERLEKDFAAKLRG